jgi:endonuclease G
MKKLHLFLSALALILFVGCEAGDDDKLPSGKKSDGNTSSGSAALIVTNGTSNDQTNTNKNVTGNNNLDSRYEIPHIVGGNGNYILIRSTDAHGINYVIEWNNAKKSQRWAAYQCYTGNSGTGWNRNNWDNQTDNEWAMLNMKEYGWGDPFQPDPDLPEEYRTELSQYKRTSYQRGHIIASQDRVNSMEANEQTFYLSNIMPQSKALNTGTWQNMESQVRNWNDNKKRDVLYVVKGGTIDDNHGSVESRSGLFVPEYFFMGIVSKLGNKYRGIAFILEHANPSKSGTQPKNYVFTIDQLEQLTGIDFFCNLPDDIEKEVESTVDRTFWGM